MSAPRRRPQRGPDPGLPIRRRRRQRKRRRPLLVLLLIVAVLVVGAAVAGGGGVYAFGSSCDLSALHEVRIGQNTFVYAADGSLLGSIPAERNRQVVPLSPGQPLDAEGDDRDRGPPLLPPRRRRPAGHRARRPRGRPGARGRPGRLDDHPAARAQPLHLERAHRAAEAQGGVPRDQAQRRLVEAAHPRARTSTRCTTATSPTGSRRRRRPTSRSRRATSPSARRRCSPG